MNYVEKWRQAMITRHYTKGDYTRQDILAFITKHLEEHSYAPSYREIGAAVGLSSTSTIHSHIKTMIKEGTLETDTEPMEPRALRVPGHTFRKLENKETPIYPSGWGYCTMCAHEVVEKQNYCSGCGQALKWKES